MQDWLIPVIVPLITALLGAVGGALGAWAAVNVKKYDPKYLQYMDEKRQAECQHVPVEAYQMKPFCEKCRKNLMPDELKQTKVLNCNHLGYTDLMNEDEFHFHYVCTACGRMDSVPRKDISFPRD